MLFEAVKCNFSSCYKNYEGEKTLNLFDTIKQVYSLPSKTFPSNQVLSIFVCKSCCSMVSKDLGNSLSNYIRQLAD